MTTFLGFDVGTQGLKALLLDPESGPVAVASRELRVIAGLPAGHSEQHPADWLTAARGAMEDLETRAPEAMRRIGAIAVSGQQHGLVPLDAGNAVIRPAMLWNDVRCAAECAQIVAALGGPAAMFAATGLAALPPGFTAGKFRWLLHHERDAFRRLAHVLLPHDYVNWWLCGELAAEAGDASGTGLLDVRRRRYDERTCEAVAPGVLGMLPPLSEPGSPVGTLRRELAGEFQLSPGTLIATGGGDNMMAAIGAGAVEPSVAVMSLGTSGTIFAFAAEPVCDPDGEIAPFCDSSGHWLPLGCTMNATVATETARALLGRSLADFESDVASAAPGSDGVLCVPYFTGERSPDLPMATGSMVGLTPRNATRSNLARAAMEGATFALARLFDRLRGLGIKADELRVTGGGSRSASWRAMVANTCNATVRDGVHADAAALGAAIQALWTWRRSHGESRLSLADCRRGLSLDSALTDLAPDDRIAAIYRESRARWQTIVDALAPTFVGGR